MTTTRIGPGQRGGFTLAALICVLVVAAGYALVLAVLGDPIWPRLWESELWIAALLLYLAFEIHREVRRNRTIAFLSPPVLASVLHFVPSYATPILAIQIDDKVLSRSMDWTGETDPFPLINTVLVLALACAVAMWVGYRNTVAIKLSTVFRLRLAGTGWVRQKIKPNIPIVLVIAVLGSGAILIQVRLGVYGYSSDYKSLIGQAQYLVFLSFGASLLSLALFLTAFAAFYRKVSRRPHGALTGLMIALFVVNVAEGFLTGFKTQVVMPAIIVGVAYFVVYRLFPLTWFVLGIVSIVAAYAVIQPFRDLRYWDTNFDSTSIVYIVKTLRKATEVERPDETDTMMEVLWHSDLVSTTSAAIGYAESVDELAPTAPDFLGAIYLSPVLALVPRVVWPDKPIYRFGRWFYIDVMGGSRRTKTSVGMGPISYFYFAGGWLAALLGFFGIGVVMRLIYSTFTPLGAGGWLIYLSVANMLTSIPSEIGPVLTGIIQTIPLALLAQSFVLRK